MENVDFTLPTRYYNNIVSNLQKFTNKSLTQAIGVVEAQKKKKNINNQ
jgi:hypothetical protein